MENRDIVIISINPWYSPLSSTSKNIARELAKKNRVLYVNAPLDRRTLLTLKDNSPLQNHRRVLKGLEKDLISVQQNLWNFYPACVMESINKLPGTRLFSWFNHLNNRKYAKAIRSAMARLNFKDFILINDKDIFRGYHLKELLHPRIYLYYDRDYTIGFDYWKKHGSVLEPRLARKSDIVITNSDHYRERLLPFNPHTYNVGSGIDLEIFDGTKQYAIPEDIASLPRPIIGYTGALIATRLNIDILVNIAQQRPDWSLALVGPEDEAFRKSALHQLKNVYFTGKKPFAEMPAYIQSFDVCLNPQVVNDITIGNYPLKIDEYLALGKPVVATATKGMKVFEQHTYLATDPKEYPRLITQALADDNEGLQRERKRFAGEHSWENIVAKIASAIENINDEKAPVNPSA